MRILGGGRARTGDGERRARRERMSPLSRRLARWLPLILIVGGVVFDVGDAGAVHRLAVLLRRPARRGTALLPAHHGGRRRGGRHRRALVRRLSRRPGHPRVGHRGRDRSDRRRAGSRHQPRRPAGTTPGSPPYATSPRPPSGPYCRCRADRIGGLAVAARYVGARADARIGGDLYAVQDTPHGVRLIVGDVRGKGLEAVEAAVIVIGAFREAAEQETSLEAVAGRLERALQREGGRRDGLDQFEGFTTAVLAEIPSKERVRAARPQPRPPAPAAARPGRRPAGTGPCGAGAAAGDERGGGVAGPVRTRRSSRPVRCCCFSPTG